MVSQPASTRPDPRPNQTWPTEAGGELTTEMNILPILIAIRRVNYSLHVRYRNSKETLKNYIIDRFYGISNRLDLFYNL